MALSDAQKLDVRRFAGYPALGDADINDISDFAYGYASPGAIRTLFHRLNTLQAEEETVLTTVYLANLTTMEAAIAGSSANLDTDSASVWKHNANEVRDRTALFNQWRRALCVFLSVAPGAGLGGGAGMTLSRG